MEPLIELKIYFIISCLLRLIVVYYIFKSAWKSKLLQYYILGLHILVESFINLLLAVLPQIHYYFYLLDVFLVLTFIYLTFHRDNFTLYIIILTILLLFEILTIIFYNYNRAFFHNLNFLIVGVWFTYQSSKAYLVVKDVKSIEPWIKTRYYLVIVYSILLFMGHLIFILDPSILLNFNFMTLLNIIIYIILLILEYLAWVIPKSLKNWLNRNYKSFKEILLSKKELNDMIEFLTDFLSQRLALSSTASRGLLKLAIKEELGKFKQMKQIHHRELRIVINNSLYKRLRALKIQGKIEIDDLQPIIKGILKKLDEGQSLLTMSRE